LLCNTRVKSIRASGGVQVVEHLAGEPEDLSSNPRTAKKKKKANPQKKPKKGLRV
jgi:hypothetical protein